MNSSNSAFESIKAGLKQAIAHAQGEAVPVQIHYPKAMDVKAIRAQVGMSQTEFASSFGISVGTLRHWERGDREPQGPARVLLHVVSKQPQVVLSALVA
jgi:putative transcriptional regulator